MLIASYCNSHALSPLNTIKNCDAGYFDSPLGRPKKRGAIFCLQQFFNLVYFGLVQINLPAKSNDFGHEFVTCNDFGDGYNE